MKKNARAKTQTYTIYIVCTYCEKKTALSMIATKQKCLGEYNNFFLFSIFLFSRINGRRQNLQ